MKTKIFFLTLSLFLCISHHALAAEFMVVTTADGIDFNPGDGKCESVLTNKPCTLRAAIMENNALPMKNSIIFAPTDNAQTYGLTAGTPLEISHPVNIIGLGADKTIIDGLSNTRILLINLITPSDPLNPGENMVYLQSVTLTKGKAKDLGGAIQNLNADLLVILDSTIGPDNVTDVPQYSATNPAPIFKPTSKKNNALGGAIYHKQGTLHIEHSTFINNSVGITATETGYGGAIYARAGTLNITNTNFENNKAHRFGQGGAIFIEGGTFGIWGNSQFNLNSASHGGAIYNESLEVDDAFKPKNQLTAVTFTDNTASSGDGGAINNHGVMQIKQSSFSSNKAQKIGPSGVGNGGAIFQDTNDSQKFFQLNTIIETSTFSENTAQNNGGAIYQRPGTITISQSNFFDNNATNDGGAIWLGNGAYVSGTLVISESLLENNHTSYGSGGAIFTKNSSNANALPTPVVKIYNSTISGNSAQQYAGGIYAADKSEFKLYHVTLAFNTCKMASSCGIMHEHLGEFDLNYAKFTLNQSLITNNNNSSGNAAGPDCFGFFTSGGGNVIGNRHETGYKSGKYYCDIENFDDNPSAGDVDLKEKFVGVNIPVIAPLAQNGGPTKTHALSLGSPAINQGLPTINSQCLKADISEIGKVKYIKDQTTINQRNVGERCDAGAYESLCGNGNIDPGEQCDNGNANSDTTPNACQKSCKNAYCGNQIIDNGEECDDGNGYSTDACTIECKSQVDEDGDKYYKMSITGSPLHDCDDTQANIHPKAEEICGDGVDQNCDNVDLSCDDVDNDGDGMTETQGDCDDNDAQVKEADNIPELCDGKDNNCDGITDGNTDGVAADDAKTFYVDADGDGHGNSEDVVKACNLPKGTSEFATDCDDTHAEINPDIKEICGDEVDQNCDGQDLDCKDVDADGDTVTPNGGDCDDTTVLASPNNKEGCDKIDNNCDGQVDEGCENIDPNDPPPFIPDLPPATDPTGGPAATDDNTGDADGEDDGLSDGESKDDAGLGPTDTGDGDNADDDDTDADADASKDKNDADADANDDGDAAADDDAAAASGGKGAGCSLNPGTVDIPLTLLFLISFVTVIARRGYRRL